MELDYIIVLFAGVGGLLSWALENVSLVRAKFDLLESRVKVGVIVGLCIIAGFSFGLQNESIGNGVLAFLVSLTSTQVTHSLRGK